MKVAKTSALLSSKIDKYQYLTGKKVLPSHHSRMLEPAKFIHCPFGKAFKNKQKQLKTNDKNKSKLQKI